MKKTNFSPLLSSPFPLSHHLQKLSVEFQIVIPTLNLRTATKERQLGREGLGGGTRQPVLQETSLTTLRRLTVSQKPVLHPCTLPTDFALLLMFM